MNTQTLAIVQGVIGMLHVLNAGIGTVTKSPVPALLLGAVLFGAQQFVQAAGNAATPPINPPPGGSSITAKTSIDGNVSVSDPKPTVTLPVTPIEVKITESVAPEGKDAA